MRRFVYRLAMSVGADLPAFDFSNDVSGDILKYPFIAVFVGDASDGMRDGKEPLGFQAGALGIVIAIESFKCLALLRRPGVQVVQMPALPDFNNALNLGIVGEELGDRGVALTAGIAVTVARHPHTPSHRKGNALIFLGYLDFYFDGASLTSVPVVIDLAQLQRFLCDDFFHICFI